MKNPFDRAHAPARRRVLQGGAALGGALAMPALSFAGSRPVLAHGVQSGDVDAESAVIWTRADRPSRLRVEVSTTESFADAWRLPPLDALPESDYAVKRLLNDLPANQEIFYRFVPESLELRGATGEPVVGRLRTAPRSRRSVRFAWSGDTAGQGWGIDDEGMKTYATIAAHAPDFLIHSGDTVYADGPMKDEVELKTGGRWINRVLPDEKRKVAETLAEFRAQWKYNLLDTHVRALNAVAPTFFQWDDHEVVNNWSSAKDLSQDARYTEKSVALLAARAGRAFHEMTPIRYTPAEPGRVYRKIAYGPMLDVFFLDLRSYRGPNGPSMQETLDADARILGAAQLGWIKRELALSRAMWKVIACDMPIGLVVWDDSRNKSGAEAISNGAPGPARGRELEIAELLAFIKHAGIRNTVWLTADVHYTAAHHYSPDRASFQDFLPFWEFVSGPLHAGTFGPNDLDPTFGPQVRFVSAPTAGQGVNLPPSMGMQFFGLVDIDGATGEFGVRLMDRSNRELWSIRLSPEGAAA